MNKIYMVTTPYNIPNNGVFRSHKISLVHSIIVTNEQNEVNVMFFLVKEFFLFDSLSHPRHGPPVSSMYSWVQLQITFDSGGDHCSPLLMLVSS